MKPLTKKIYSLLGHLPLIHVRWVQRFIWEKRDWSYGGEEWTVSETWKGSLIREVLEPNIKEGDTVLEIGPGAGRWTEALQKITEKLLLVDLSPKCIERCKKRFGQFSNLEYFINNGKGLSFIRDETVDFVWSFDTFVHMAPKDISAYLKEIHRVLKAGGRGIIHHAGKGSRYGGWRSSMTAALFTKILEESNLRMMRQFDSWGEGKFDVRAHQDVLTFFGK